LSCYRHFDQEPRMPKPPVKSKNEHVSKILEVGKRRGTSPINR
jgi:hypothetical protein